MLVRPFMLLWENSSEGFLSNYKKCRGPLSTRKISHFFVCKIRVYSSFTRPILISDIPFLYLSINTTQLWLYQSFYDLYIYLHVIFREDLFLYPLYWHTLFPNMLGAVYIGRLYRGKWSFYCGKLAWCMWSYFPGIN